MCIYRQGSTYTYGKEREKKTVKVSVASETLVNNKQGTVKGPQLARTGTIKDVRGGVVMQIRDFNLREW